MSAVLTAFKTHPIDSFLVVGVDYPLLAVADLKKLLEAREAGTNTVCMYHADDKMEEPLIAVYENGIRDALVNQFKSGDFSLRRLLHNTPTKHVLPLSFGSIRSADTKEVAQLLIKLIP